MNKFEKSKISKEEMIDSLRKVIKDINNMEKPKGYLAFPDTPGFTIYEVEYDDIIALRAMLFLRIKAREDHENDVTG